MWQTIIPWRRTIMESSQAPQKTQQERQLEQIKQGLKPLDNPLSSMQRPASIVDSVFQTSTRVKSADGKESIYGADGKLIHTIDHTKYGETILTNFDENGKSTGFKIFKDGKMVNEVKRED